MTRSPSLAPQLIAAVFAVLLALPPAVAQEREWEYELEVSGSEASLEMRSESNGTERAVSFEYDRDEAAVEFAYEAEVGGNESEARMEVQFHQLVEYEDENGNGRYDDGEEIVSAYSLNEDDEEFLVEDAEAAAWGPIQRSEHTSDDGVPGTKFSSTASIGSGSIRFDFYVYGDEATLGAATVEPTEVKLDIAIDGYPYQSESSALALFLESEAEAEIETDSDVEGDEEGVAASAGDARLLFTWKDFATVDGSDHPVHTTKLESHSSQEPGEFEHEELLVFSYTRGGSILHDPTMGISSASASTSGIPAAGVGLLVVALAAAVLWSRKS